MMKKRSIRFKIMTWFSLVLIMLVGLTFFVVRLASEIVLRTTIRDYLIGAVEENVNKIQFTEEKLFRAGSIYIPYQSGFLEVDEDFLDVINDVHTALYTAEGTMLYGENPLARQAEVSSFSESRTWREKIDGVSYGFYDRKLNLPLPGDESLWIRGIASETRGADQLQEVSRISGLLLPVLLAFSVAFGYLLTGRLLRPIRRMEKTAEQISQGTDLKQRLDVGTSQDEIGRLAAVFNRMFARLERSFEAERQFTSDASHELRTPTSVILAECEYMLEKPRSTDEYEEALRVVQKQGQRMTDLIEDLLDYTRLEQRPEQYALERLDLSSLTVEMAESLTIPDRNGITLQTEIAPGVEIRGSRMLLSRLLENLISNAYRYGRENGHILVRLQAEPGDGSSGPVLSVCDDGMGIAAEEQEKIFDRFYRGDHSRSIPGTGLGLSMVKKIAERHGAEVRVESSPGQGSTFQILFPILSPF